MAYYGPTPLTGQTGGTGVDNGTKTITLGGNLTTSGAHNFIATLTADTNITFPTTGTLATTSQLPANPLTVATGGTGVQTIDAYALVAGGTTDTGTLQTIAGGLTGQVLQGAGVEALPTYSTATYPAVATGTGTILRADGTNWSATTSTYPNTNAVSTLLYASSANVMGALATANNGLLVTSATGVPSILADGTTGQVLTATTGAPPSWAAAGGGVTNVTRQVFTSGSASYTPTSGTKFCDCEVLAGGGGGGGCAAAVTGVSFGACGGAGGYSRKVVAVATVTGQTVTVGGGGAGGIAGNNAGTTGTTSSIGSVITATGGVGGGGGANATSATVLLTTIGGLGGLGASGDFNTNGAPGGNAACNLSLHISGNAGSSLYGGGALGVAVLTGNGTAGNAATNYGSGGSGGLDFAASTARAGGNGSGGIVIITEYQ